MVVVVVVVVVVVSSPGLIENYGVVIGNLPKHSDVRGWESRTCGGGGNRM